MTPGRSVTPPSALIFAPGGMRTELASPTAAILLSVTMTTALVIGAAPVPSIRRAARKATIPLPTGGSGRIPIGAELWGITEMERQETRAQTNRNNLYVLTHN